MAVGSFHLTQPDPDQENIPVKRIVLHENYDSFTIQNDICLLELETAATMGEHVGTIALPAALEEYEEGTMCTVTGWGKTGEQTGDDPYTYTLQKVENIFFNTPKLKN